MSQRTSDQQHDVGILLPQIPDWEKTHVRYGGLVDELISKELSVVLLETQSSYRGDGEFTNARTPQNAVLGAMQTEPIEEPIRAVVVRDLTMPKDSTRLYEDPNRPLLVHPPELNEFFKSKSSVYELMPHIQPFTIPRVDAKDLHEAMAEVPGEYAIIKPDTGSASKGVMIGRKRDLATQLAETGLGGQYIVQEAIDMSRGLPEHSVLGAHNLRFIVIGGTAIFGFIRDDGGTSLTLANEGPFRNRSFKLPEDYSVGFQSILAQAQHALTGLESSDKAILAVDLMRGVNAAGEEREYLLEINRRPVRNSPFDGKDVGTLWASHQWDVAEANLLNDAVKGTK